MSRMAALGLPGTAPHLDPTPAWDAGRASSHPDTRPAAPVPWLTPPRSFSLLTLSLFPGQKLLDGAELVSLGLQVPRPGKVC